MALRETSSGHEKPGALWIFIRVSKQISTYIDHFIKCYRIIRVLDENVFKKIFVLFSGKVKVRQYKKSQITLYPTVITIKMGSIEREREREREKRVLKEKERGPIWH